MYSEFADDPKVQMMSESDQRRLVMLFCEKCKDVKHDETLRSFHWRITPLELGATKAVFLANGFIDEQWNLLNWNRRQFLSDSSTERVRKFRERLQHNETLQSTNVTPPDTDTDTDTEQKQKKKTLARSVPPEELAGTLPLVDGTEYLISKTQVREWTEAYPGINVRTELLGFKAWLNANPTRQKTPRGICRSIIHWLSGAQNKSHGTGGNKTNGKIENTLSATQIALAELRSASNSAGGNSYEAFGNPLFPSSPSESGIPDRDVGKVIEGKP
jgi:hypothetical protein